MRLGKVIRLLILIALLGSAGILVGEQANAHGTMTSPVSRVYGCFLQGPESPDTAACQYAVSVGGTQPLYDWNEVNIANAAGNHRALIPDGKLCSANRSKYAAFDAARSDWPSSTMSAGTRTFTFRATAPHRGHFEIYITNSGWSPSSALRWGDISQIARIVDPPLSNGSYTFSVNVPSRSGRHVIYTIWQRSDSPEAFYTCSDVVFGGGTVPTNTPGTNPTRTPTRTGATATRTATRVGATPTRTNTPSSGATTWAPNTWYNVGAVVSYAGRNYRCIQAHTSLVGWEPPNVPALWSPQ